MSSVKEAAMLEAVLCLCASYRLVILEPTGADAMVLAGEFERGEGAFREEAEGQRLEVDVKVRGGRREDYRVSSVAVEM